MLDVSESPRKDDLRTYVRMRGIQHDGVWYFAGNWMDKDTRHYLLENGIIERAGTLRDLRNEGIDIQQNLRENATGTTVFYAVKSDKLVI